MLGPITRSTLLGRNVMKSFIRNGSHGGIPGQNLPFDIHNRTKLTLHFIWYGVTGLSAPFLITLYQLYKK